MSFPPTPVYRKSTQNTQEVASLVFRKSNEFRTWVNALAGLESYWTHHNVVLLSHASGRDESAPQDVGRQQTGLSHLASHLKLKKSHEQLGRMRFPSGEFAMQCQKGISLPCITSCLVENGTEA